ncbi:MAG: hypothetical protein AAFN08_10385 [Cyanobacteria bacterium J06559_3]
MSETPSENLQRLEDELLPECDFDYRKGKPNRFANQDKTRRLTLVALDEDVAKVFTTTESVNKALRALIEAMPK